MSMPRSRVQEPSTRAHSGGNATQNGLSNAAYAVVFQESGSNSRHANKGQTIPLLDLVAGWPVDESIAQRNGCLVRLPSGSTLDQWKWLPLSQLTRILDSKGSMRCCCLYKSLVTRPILEYAAAVWSPYQQVKDTKSLEKIQRRPSQLALKQKRGEMSYGAHCRLLNWQTLEKRREFLSLV